VILSVKMLLRVILSVKALLRVILSVKALLRVILSVKALLRVILLLKTLLRVTLSVKMLLQTLSVKMLLQTLSVKKLLQTHINASTAVTVKKTKQTTLAVIRHVKSGAVPTTSSTNTLASRKKSDALLMFWTKKNIFELLKEEV
jgi:hypothetical protein